MAELTDRAQKMLARWKGPAAPTLAEPALRALLDEKEIPVLPAFLAFEARYSGKHWNVFGDPAERSLGIAQGWRETDKRPQAHGQKSVSGWVVQCLRIGSRPPRALCLDELGAIRDAGLALPAPGDAHPYAASIEQVIEWDAVVDEIGSSDAIWYALRAQVPDGVARALAERLAVAPVPEASSADLAAWADPKLRIRTSKTHRLIEPRTIVLDAYAATRATATELARALGEITTRPPLQPTEWPGTGVLPIERV